MAVRCRCGGLPIPLSDKCITCFVNPELWEIRMPVEQEQIDTTDALSALTNLGYPKALAKDAISRAIELGANDTESLIRQSLKQLAK